MKVSYNWLNEYLNFSASQDEISSILTSTGLEVEGVSELFAAFDHLVVGKVLECVPHPNADRLKITQVDVGANVKQIICGAKNVRKNQLVVVVLAGNQLISEKGDIIKIKKTKIRGEVSDGMICGEDEIGLGDNHEGIMELNGNVKPGSLVRDFLHINKDYVLEIGLTPNRTDAFGHIGVCRDLYAYFHHKGEKLTFSLPDVSSYVPSLSQLSCNLDVQDVESCPKYYGVCIENIRVEPSPSWLQNKLISIGLKPINNVVDITNFVLHETGNPLHAFDYDKINNKTIVVRKAKEGEKFQTLDSNEIDLSINDLVICDSNKPICLAGVMGGENSGVTQTTQNIFLESAYFNPISVRKTSKSHGIISDSSYRFERGVDFNNCEFALKRAALLIQDICGGIIGEEVCFNSNKLKNIEIDFPFTLCDQVLGCEIDNKEKIQILNNLGFIILSEEKNACRLSVPAFRADVNRPIDVVEEVGRIYGYDNLPSAQFFKFQSFPELNFTLHDLKLKLSSLLVSNGFFEIQCNSLVSSNVTSIFNNSVNSVKLLNPLSKDLSIMRPTMFFGGLQTIRYNLNRQIKSLKLFEFGKVYSYVDKKYLEQDKLTLFACGIFKDDNWHDTSKEIDFFLIKGVFYKLLSQFQIDESRLQVDEVKKDYSDFNLSYHYQDNVIAQMGNFSMVTLNKLGVKKMVYYLDLNLENLLSMLNPADVKYSPALKFPAINRDLALLVDSNITYAQLKHCIRDYNSQLLKRVSLFDVYEGDKIDKNKKSYAISFLFQDSSRTLTDKEVDIEMRGIYNKLVSVFQLSLRDGEL